MADFLQAVFVEGGRGCLAMMWKVLYIVMPLMVGMALLEYWRLFERLAGGIGSRLRRLGLGEHAILPLLVGALLGVSYGAGALLQAGREGKLGPSEVGILGLFLGLCHALVEDTALIAAAGASLWWLLPGRFVVTVAVTALCWRWVVPAAAARPAAAA